MSISLVLRAVGAYSGRDNGDFQHHFRELTNRVQIVRIADVVDLAVGDAVRIVDDGGQALDRVVDEGKGASLRAAVDQFDRLAAHDMPQELREHARAALLRIIHAVEAGSDPVEGPEQRELQSLLSISPDDPVQELLHAGINPALLMDGT